MTLLRSVLRAVYMILSWWQFNKFLNCIICKHHSFSNKLFHLLHCANIFNSFSNTLRVLDALNRPMWLKIITKDACIMAWFFQINSFAMPVITSSVNFAQFPGHLPVLSPLRLSIRLSLPGWTTVVLFTLVSLLLTWTVWIVLCALLPTLLVGYLNLTIYLLIFIHSFILNISIALLQGDYSGALPIPIRSKRKVFRWAKA